MNYDTPLFIEIIESVQGISFLRLEHKDGVHVRFYQGLKGKLVMIDTSYEDLTPTQGKAYLEQLGLSYLASTLFPEPQPEPAPVPAQIGE